MKKLTKILTSVMLLALVASCDNGGSKTSTTSSKPSTTTTVSVAPKAEYTFEPNADLNIAVNSSNAKIWEYFTIYEADGTMVNNNNAKCKITSGKLDTAGELKVQVSFGEQKWDLTLTVRDYVAEKVAALKPLTELLNKDDSVNGFKAATFSAT